MSVLPWKPMEDMPSKQVVAEEVFDDPVPIRCIL